VVPSGTVRSGRALKRQRSTRRSLNRASPKNDHTPGLAQGSIVRHPTSRAVPSPARAGPLPGLPLADQPPHWLTRVDAAGPRSAKASPARKQKRAPEQLPTSPAPAFHHPQAWPANRSGLDRAMAQNSRRQGPERQERVLRQSRAGLSSSEGSKSSASPPATGAQPAGWRWRPRRIAADPPRGPPARRWRCNGSKGILPPIVRAQPARVESCRDWNSSLASGPSSPLLFPPRPRGRS